MDFIKYEDKEIRLGGPHYGFQVPRVVATIISKKTYLVHWSPKDDSLSFQIDNPVHMKSVECPYRKTFIRAWKRAIIEISKGIISPFKHKNATVYVGGKEEFIYKGYYRQIAKISNSPNDPIYYFANPKGKIIRSCLRQKPQLKSPDKTELALLSWAFLKFGVMF